jgi:hypothetical protein
VTVTITVTVTVTITVTVAVTVTVTIMEYYSSNLKISSEDLKLWPDPVTR